LDLVLGVDIILNYSAVVPFGIKKKFLYQKGTLAETSLGGT